jgi:hypothetical protein
VKCLADSLPTEGPGTDFLPRMVALRGCRKGGAYAHTDSTLSGSDLIERMFSGGVAPGYCMYPLRGSKRDNAEVILERQKGAQVFSRPLGLRGEKRLW